MSMIRPEPGLALRVLRHPMMLLVLGFVPFTGLYGFTAMAGSRIVLLRHSPLQPLAMLGCCAAAVGLYLLFQRHAELRGNREFAWNGAASELGAGLAGGFALFSVVAGVVWLAGGMEVTGLRGGIGSLWGMLSLALISGLFEELVFRGIVFRHLETLLGSWAALALTSAFFGAVHLGNPGATLFAAFAVAMEAGLLLGAAYMLTRRLWLAIGLHAAWNFTQGWVWSVPVSGGSAPNGLLLTRFHGPEWLTGGAFGLEASVVALVVVSLAGLALLVAVQRRGHLIAPSWQRKLAQTPGDTA